MEDCLGGDLYSQLKEKVKTTKSIWNSISAKGIPTIGKSIPCTSDWKNWKQTTFLHEMFHVFQTTQEPISSFKSSMMNREIEAHYAQYLFLQRSAEWTDKKQDKYAKSQRLRATTSLTKICKSARSCYNFISWISLKPYISNNVVNAFRQEGYDTLSI